MSEDASSDGTADADPTDEEVVRTAAEAAEGVVFEHYDQSAVTDLDVTVTFEAGVLDVDVYLNAPDGPDDPDPETVAEAATTAAGDAVDELFEE
ncbi:DUF3194 domain-containing protein [Halorubrum sp. 48-1-W]|uniref:DUF3194 domain-containing protein n=1 Tax=Halorubrum sp. 48-1-W TaxID=2249761 RepID=UPI000DCDB55D|nr:DUF3194 domain-containing protein [Halorubrum sp. 48-1-W]RAW46525.1 DUF3194 domain-containing protein [Halorubrum sp. 48-1-W]